MWCPEPEEDRFGFQCQLSEIDFSAGQVGDKDIRVIGVGELGRRHRCRRAIRRWGGCRRALKRIRRLAAPTGGGNKPEGEEDDQSSHGLNKLTPRVGNEFHLPGVSGDF